MASLRTASATFAVALQLLTAAACGGDKPAQVAAEELDAPLRVTVQGVGPVRAGMTLAEASAAVGAPIALPPGADTAGCSTVRWPFAPDGVSLMVERQRIVRVDVTAPTIATDAGARVGDPEDRVLSLYVGRVTVTPHKYTAGHYLTVISPSPGDSAYRLIFETDSGRVTRFRVGRLPQVEYVEGCS